jgi:hypothetical protein
MIQRMTITTVPDLVENLTPVVFPEDDISAEQELRLRRQIRDNCDYLLSFIQYLLPLEAKNASHMAILTGMRKEVMELRQECGTLALLSLQPRSRSQRLARISELYEEVRVSAVLLGQQVDISYTDAIASAL